MAGKPITKKIINSPETCVDDNLRGVVATYPSLQLHPKHRVITVRNKADTKRVAVLGGGGSGHEPFAGGLVGVGMLDGAVAGGVFASPPTGHVLYGIAQLYKYNSGGVIVIIGNYTGDRLNFGKAIEKAKIAGIKVEGLIVGEDVASSKNKTGGRSMCGEVFFYKLCGGMAAKGYDLQTMKDIAAEANKFMATLGVCLSACSLPGQPPLFEIADDEMELGAGVHGEAGIEKLKMGTAKEVVTMILEKIIAHLKLVAGNRIAVMIDNLGGTSFLEMNIIAAETKDYLESKQIKVERIFSGHFKTSLEMHGFQICLLHLNKQYGDLWLELLDFPTDAVGWAGGVLSAGSGEHGDDETLLQINSRKLITGPILTAKEQDILKGSLEAAAKELVKNEGLLNKLDSGCGDGDCGNTLKKFGLAILSYFKSASSEYPSNVLWDLSEIAETDMGGTSGGIYSLGLSAASQTIARLVWSSPSYCAEPDRLPRPKRPILTAKEQDILKGSLEAAAKELVKNEGLLNKLDSGCGDGDCGNTLKKFGLAILSYFKSASSEYPSNVLWDLSEIAETDMGGTSGGIYSLGLSAASQTIASGKSNDVKLWLSAWESAMAAITKYGGAEPGDRTMLDTLHSAAEMFKQNLKSDFKVLLKKTADAADKAAKDTAHMTAKAGRASYVASVYTKDEDAGARAAAIWLQAILDFISNKY